MDKALKVRLDLFLAQQGYYPSREKAKIAIGLEQVKVNGVIVTSTKFLVDGQDIMDLDISKDVYVGRGALKLLHAVQTFHLDLQDATVLDIGASTGGFTQVCLQHGAKQVFALDVGSDQLDLSLRKDDRVVVMDKTNFRYAEASWFPTKMDFICSDVSFISLSLIIPALAVCTKDSTQLVLLVKPQFEAGREFLNKHGVITSKDVRHRVLHDVIRCLHLHGYSIAGLVPSPVTGKDGNVEYLLFATVAVSKLPMQDHALVDVLVD